MWWRTRQTRSGATTPACDPSADGATLWLAVGDLISIGVPLSEAMSYTEDEFVVLYKRHVLCLRSGEAEAWAREQVKARGLVAR